MRNVAAHKLSHCANQRRAARYVVEKASSIHQRCLGLLSGLAHWANWVKLPEHGDASTVDPYFHVPFITLGYRHVSCVSECILSSLTLSNEVVNIWSHAFLALYAMSNIYRFLCEITTSTDYSDSTGSIRHGDNVVQVVGGLQAYLPLLVHQVGSMTSAAASAIAHLLHSQSEWHHQMWFLVDYAAIGFYNLGLAIAQYSLSRPLSSGTLANVIWSADTYIVMAMCCHLGVFVLQCSMQFLFHSSPFRPILLVSSYGAASILNFLPFLNRVVAGESYASDALHWAEIISISVGAVIMAAQLPERMWPDHFYHLNSHSIMHITAAISYYCQTQAFHMDLARWEMFPESLRPRTDLLVGVLLIYLLSSSSILYYVLARYGSSESKAQPYTHADNKA
ncbi:membrane progestin receptor gamma-like [Sycon ciliatum]|uniref:membrane progestin receptor gamma-like n=1 Tax=Sycon ciliatum TaxID=27933 RepID=UPI0031F5F082